MSDEDIAVAEERVKQARIKLAQAVKVIPFKWTVSVMSSDPPCKDENSRSISMNYISIVFSLKTHYFQLWFLYKVTCALIMHENI